MIPAAWRSSPSNIYTSPLLLQAGQQTALQRAGRHTGLLSSTTAVCCPWSSWLTPVVPPCTSFYDLGTPRTAVRCTSVYDLGTTDGSTVYLSLRPRYTTAEYGVPQSTTSAHYRPYGVPQSTDLGTPAVRTPAYTCRTYSGLLPSVRTTGCCPPYVLLAVHLPYRLRPYTCCT